MSGSVRKKLDLSLLYAEDEAISRSVLYEVLATKVRTVYQAVNGREGLELFLEYRPDVVLVDNNMPEMDGISLARSVLEVDPSTHIIIVSGDIRRHNLTEMEQMKLHYIKKPIRIRQLLDLLHNLKNGADIPADLAARSVTPR